MAKHLHVLIVEDSEEDTSLLVDAMRDGGLDPVYERVETAEGLSAALESKTWDVALCEYSLPKFSGSAALGLIRQSGLDVPIIMVSGVIGEENAAEVMRAGAHDLILKENLTRLAPVIERELSEAEAHREQRKAEDVVRKLSRAIEQSPVSVVITDVDGKIEYVNPAFTEVTGYDFKEVIGENPRILKSGDTSPEQYKRLWETITSGAVWRGEFHNKKKNGELFWESVSIAPVKNADGVIAHFVAVKENTTERKRAEEEIAEKSTLLGTALESMSQGISVRDADLRLLAFNQRFVKLRGYPPGFIRLGQSYEEVARFNAERGDYGPGDVEELVKERVAAVRQGKEKRVERVRPDGTVFAIRRTPMPDGGFVTTFTDITERKRVEAALTEKSALLGTALESMSQGIAVRDADLRLLAFNQRFVKLRGYPPGFIRLGQSYEEVARFDAERGDYGPGDVEELVKERVERWRQGKEERAERVLPDGTVLEWYRNPLPDGGFVTTFTDITERKRAEEALQVSEARLMEAQRIARVGSWAWDVQTGKVDASDEVYRIFGLKRQQYTLRFDALAHRVHAGDKDLRRYTIDTALHYGEFYKIDYRVTHPDLGMRTIREQGNVTLDAAGRPAHVVGTVQDITDFKKSERELMERNRELQTLFSLSEITVGGQPLEAALRQIVEIISRDSGFPIVTIERYDEARQKMLIQGTKGFSLSRGAKPVEVPAEETLSEIVVRSGRPLIETWGLGRPAYARRTRHLPDVQTFIGVPVATGNQIIGALCFAHGEVIPVDESRLKWMANLARSVAALMERKWAEEILRQPDEQAEVLTERFLKEGMGSLSDQEMIVLVLLPVLGRFNIIPVAKRLLARFGSFAEIISADPQALAEVKGVGKYTITALKAVQGAAVRLVRQDILGRPVVSSWNKLLDYCRASMAYAKKEEFRVLFLDRKNVLIADEVQQTGTVDHTPVYPREVMKRALDLGASAIIMVHNHPSDDPTPSRDDIEITKEVREAGEKLAIALHDHLIIGRRGHASLKSLDLL